MNGYYIRKKRKVGESDYFEEVRGEKFIVEGWEDFDFFIYQSDYGYWVSTEGSTGMRLSGMKDLDLLKRSTKILLDSCGKEKFTKIVEEQSRKVLSPRYT